jgi:hypothetical protein
VVQEDGDVVAFVDVLTPEYAPPLAAWEPVIGESRGQPFG